jgi:hypothetical protein
MLRQRNGKVAFLVQLCFLPLPMANLPFQREVAGNGAGRNESEGGLGLIRGAKKLAGFIFDDEEEWKKVYPLKDDLGLFRLNGMICGRPETIVSRIAELEGRKSDAEHPA